MNFVIAILGNTIESMVRFRGPLIRDLVEQGHRVIAICPDGPEKMRVALGALGAVHRPVNCLSRSGLSPRGELDFLRNLTAILREVRPDRIFSYFLKPVIWGAIAGRLAGIPRSIGMIEGLGFAFSSPPSKLNEHLVQRIARAGALGLLRPALLLTDHVFVLNKDDEALFLERRLIQRNRLTRLDGIGVDLEHYAFVPPHVSPVRFTLAARLIREKGIANFALAARMVRAEFPEARFQLLGGVDDAPGALQKPEIDAWVEEGILEWPGPVPDVRPHLRKTSVFVLPSEYREGLPRSIMEAMAMGRPVITTNTVGCRDSVTDERSGLLVPPGDPQALAAACARFLRNPGLVVTMGRTAHAEACRRYDVYEQNAAQVSAILG